MIDPSADHEKNYLFLVELQKFALGELKDGAVCKDVYQKVVDKIEADRADLLPYFAKTAGFGVRPSLPLSPLRTSPSLSSLTLSLARAQMGLEFRDSAYPLTAKGSRVVKADMIFSLTLGFNGIPDPKKSGATYAVSLVDTVQVGKDGAKCLSEGMKGKDDVMFYMEVRRSLSPSLRPLDIVTTCTG